MPERRTPPQSRRNPKGGTTVPPGVARRSSPTRANPPDRSFGRILQSRSVDKILPEAVARLEAGRRSFADQSLKAVDAELALIDAEGRRLEKEKAGEAKMVRLSRLRAVVEADLAASKQLNAEIKQGLRHEPQGWTVIGRVRSDKPLPARAEIVFLGEDNELVKDLEPITVGADGMVRKSYPAEIAKQLQGRRAQVAAALRVGQKIVKVGERRTPVRADRVYQFDLSLDQR